MDENVLNGRANLCGPNFSFSDRSTRSIDLAESLCEYTIVGLALARSYCAMSRTWTARKVCISFNDLAVLVLSGLAPTSPFFFSCVWCGASTVLIGVVSSRQ